MKELQDGQRYIERDARPTCGPAHKNIDSKTGSVGTAVCHQYRLRSVKQGRPSHGGGSAGSYRDFRSNCPGSSPWRSSGSAATRKRGCCKIGRQVIPLSEAPAGVARWRLSRTKVNRGWTAVPFLAVRQAPQVAATAPSAYGTCRSRQTRNQQVHKCSSPCSCQLTPGRVNSRETCARRLPAKDAAAFRKPVAVDKPHGTSDRPALGVNRDSGMFFGVSREPCPIQVPPERHFLKTKLSIGGRMRSFHTADNIGSTVKFESCRRSMSRSPQNAWSRRCRTCSKSRRRERLIRIGRYCLDLRFFRAGLRRRRLVQQLDHAFVKPVSHLKALGGPGDGADNDVDS